VVAKINEMLKDARIKLQTRIVRKPVLICV